MNLAKQNKNIFDINIKTQLKLLMTLKQISMEKLAEKMTELSGEKYTSAKLYGKINRDSISFTEVQMIAKILGFKIEFNEVFQK